MAKIDHLWGIANILVFEHFCFAKIASLQMHGMKSMGSYDPEQNFQNLKVLCPQLFPYRQPYLSFSHHNLTPVRINILKSEFLANAVKPVIVNNNTSKGTKEKKGFCNTLLYLAVYLNWK